MANRNYETDGDGRRGQGGLGRRGWKYQRSAEDIAHDARRYQQCQQRHENCNYVGQYLGRCEALDLLTLQRCTREHRDGENFCDFHDNLEFLFFYRNVFTFNFTKTSVMNIMMNNSRMNTRIRYPYGGQRPNAAQIREMQAAGTEYLNFFKKYHLFIFFGYEEHRGLMEAIFKNNLRKNRWVLKNVEE